MQINRSTFPLYRMAVKASGPGAHPELSGVTEKLLPQATKVYAANIVRYVESRGYGTVQDTLEAIPNLAPPLSNLWMEAPSTIINKSHHKHHFGAHVLSGRQKEGQPDSAWRDEVERALGEKVSSLMVGDSSDIEWWVVASVWCGKEDTACVEQGYVSYAVDERGSLIRDVGDLPVVDWSVHPNIDDVSGADAVAVFVPNLLYSIGFMHCKNTQLVDRVTPIGKSGGRARKGGGGTVTYKLLRISSIKKALRDEGDVDEHGLDKALHICRGHFKDYRDSGLFGKYHDVFWWDPHVRGSADQGVVVKDYAPEAV